MEKESLFGKEEREIEYYLVFSFLTLDNPILEGGEMDLFTSTKEMAATARASNRSLKVVTNSGSTYLLHPVEGELDWLISRHGIDGRLSIEYGTVHGHVSSQGRNGLIIGSWETTGLRSVELV